MGNSLAMDCSICHDIELGFWKQYRAKVSQRIAETLRLAGKKRNRDLKEEVNEVDVKRRQCNNVIDSSSTSNKTITNIWSQNEGSGSCS